MYLQVFLSEWQRYSSHQPLQYQIRIFTSSKFESVTGRHYWSFVFPTTASWDAWPPLFTCTPTAHCILLKIILLYWKLLVCNAFNSVRCFIWTSTVGKLLHTYIAKLGVVRHLVKVLWSDYVPQWESITLKGINSICGLGRSQCTFTPTPIWKTLSTYLLTT